MAAGLVAAFAGLTPSGPAQILELGPDEAPVTTGPSAAELLVAALEPEIASAIPSPQLNEHSIEAIVARAKLEVRLVAAELLERGRAAQGPEADLAVMVGTQLAEERAAIDAAVDELLPDGSAGREDATAERALEAFGRAARRLSAQLREDPDVDLRAAIPAALMPLADALESITGTPVRSQWPTNAAIEAGRGATARTAADDAPPTTAQLREALGAEPVRADTAESIGRLLDIMQRGEAFADLRPRVREYRAAVARCFEVARTLEDARGVWLDAALSRSLDDRLHAVVTLLNDPLARKEGIDRLRRLSAAGSLVARVTHLAGDPHADLAPIVTAFKAADRLLAVDSAEPPEQSVRTLAAILDRMIRRREQPADDTRGDMRTTQRRLLQRCRESETELIDRLEQAVDPEAMADPDFASLVERHCQLLEDTERLARVPAWVEIAERIDRRFANGVATNCRVWATWLIDPVKRADALEMFERLERELDTYRELPIEAALRAGDATALQLCGGLDGPFLATIDRQRHRWIGAWSRGAPDEGGREIALLYRLCSAMADNAGTLRLGSSAAMLNRWAAWSLGVESMDRAVVGLPARLKVAVAESIDGRPAGLERQLDEIERDTPLARLLGRLADRLGATLERYPAGVAGTLAQIVIPPGEDAWQGERRDAFARLCRYAREEASARMTGNAEDARVLGEFVSTLAEKMLAEVE